MEQIDPIIVTHLAYTFFNITPVENQIVALNGYSDKNFSITDVASKKKYVLKIVNPEDSSNQKLIDIIDQVLFNAYTYSKEVKGFSTPKIYKTCSEKLSALAEIELKDEEGQTKKTLNNVKLFEFLSGQTACNFINSTFKLSKHDLERVYWKLGLMCGNITHFFATQSSYLNELTSIRNNFEWQTSTCDKIISRLADLLYPNRYNSKRIMIDHVLEEFASIKQRFDALPQHILHGDFSGKNILINCHNMSNSDFQLSLLDFQDLQVGPRCVELATLIMYCVLEQTNVPFGEALKQIPKLIIEGYFNSNIAQFFNTQQLEFVPIVMKLRLCLSLLNGQIAFEKDPNNDYVFETNKAGWILLQIMLYVGPFNNNNELINMWLPKTMK